MEQLSTNNSSIKVRERLIINLKLQNYFPCDDKLFTDAKTIILKNTKQDLWNSIQPPKNAKNTYNFQDIAYEDAFKQILTILGNESFLGIQYRSPTSKYQQFGQFIIEYERIIDEEFPQVHLFIQKTKEQLRLKNIDSEFFLLGDPQLYIQIASILQTEEDMEVLKEQQTKMNNAMNYIFKVGTNLDFKLDEQQENLTYCYKIIRNYDEVFSDKIKYFYKNHITWKTSFKHYQIRLKGNVICYQSGSYQNQNKYIQQMKIDGKSIISYLNSFKLLHIFEADSDFVEPRNFRLIDEFMVLSKILAYDAFEFTQDRQLKNIFTGEERQESHELLNKIQRLFLSQQERIQKLEIQVHTMDHKYELRFQKIEQNVSELQKQAKQQQQSNLQLQQTQQKQGQIQDIILQKMFQSEIKEKKVRCLSFSGEKTFQQCKGDGSQSLENIEEQYENITINSKQQNYQQQQDNELGTFQQAFAKSRNTNYSKNKDTKFDAD